MNNVSEKIICQNCKQDFTIEPEDFNFYEKIKVPPPTWCLECRLQRRYAWRNERVFYRRNCDLCKKSIVTFYSPNKPHKVYCIKCWWGDGWDPTSFGQDFDFSKSFFEQFRELQLKVPRIAVFNKNNVNSDYTNHSGDNKNCFLSSCCFKSEDVLYSNWIIKSRSSLDNSYIYENGERLYECIDSRKSYRCQYSILVENCTDCLYCYDCHNCNNCFLSSNLRNKSYVFQNTQYSREEYFLKINEYKLSSYNTREELYKKFIDICQKNAIHRYVISERNINCSGSTLFNSKNSKNCFDADSLEDCKNVFSAISVKSSMDLYHIGWNTELSYELHGGDGSYNCQFCHHGWGNTNAMYCDSCQSCQNTFGCISVKKGKYMIFNKKYTKETYEILKNKIIEHMKKTGEYGEFFPPYISPICYNETQGNYYMPLSKEEALSRGWQWEDNLPGIFGKETLQPEDVKDSITDIDDTIQSEVLKCVNCSRNYNIAPYEFSFYKQEVIPIPRMCPECRHKRRFALRLPRKLWHRKCMKKGCENEFETAYAPDRPEIVYCERCYQQEVY